MRSSVALLLATVCLFAVDAHRILVVFPFPAKSHSILGDGVVRHLAAAGHDITYITPMPQTKPAKNVRQIDVKEIAYHFPVEIVTIKSIMDKTMGLSVAFILGFIFDVNNATFHHPKVREMLLDTNQEFDLVIAEWMLGEVLSGFAAILNTPLIWVSTVDPHWMVLRLIDEATNPAYVPDIFSTGTPPFTFVERVTQLGNQLTTQVLKKIFFDNLEHKLYSDLAPYFSARGREPPAYQELIFNASLMLGNSHVSMGQATSLPQSYKPIGGYHIDTKVAPLPEDLKNLLDNAKHGVIYFSMGSNLKSKNMPEELKTSLLRMFGELKQDVIWKFEEVLPEKPSNVHIIQWAPQPAILAHPNCVLFITHGGLLSTTETIHFATPIIGIPVFGDQFVNVGRAVAKGFAKKVDLSLNMANDLKAAINDMLQDPKYLNKVKELSFIYHDRPMTPGQELVHWTEHVIRTRGAPHLRSPALNVPFYQKLYLDLFALIVAVVLVIRLAIRRLFKKFSQKQKTQ